MRAFTVATEMPSQVKHRTDATCVEEIAGEGDSYLNWACPFFRGDERKEEDADDDSGY